MDIRDVIQHMKDHAATEWLGRKIEEETTRDQVLFGDPDRVCTGVAVCIYPSIGVIERAIELGCNLIACHESLFWNHGDHTAWLEGNDVYQAKRELLERGGICVWRNHDHIHAGVLVDGVRRDGIFYGVAEQLGWLDYLLEPDALMPQLFEIPTTRAVDLGRTLARAFRLNGVRFVGNEDARVSRVLIPMHITGRPQQDNELIERLAAEDIDALIAMEIVDFTVCEHVRDAGALGRDRCIFSVGHFNVEQPGMAWYAGYLARELGDSVPVHMLWIDDMYKHLSFA